jgi:hypothetical protein
MPLFLFGFRARGAVGRPAGSSTNVSITGPLEKVLTTAPAGTRQSLQMSAARNAFESFQVATFRPIGRSLERATSTSTAIPTSSGATPPATLPRGPLTARRSRKTGRWGMSRPWSIQAANAD